MLQTINIMCFCFIGIKPRRLYEYYMNICIFSYNLVIDKLKKGITNYSVHFE